MAKNKYKLKTPSSSFAAGIKSLFFPAKRMLDCVQIEVSSFCMGRCSYCPRAVQENSWQSRYLMPETMEKLWPLLSHSTRAHLQGWGEPFTNPYFFEFAKFASDAGCQISTTTCGLVMNDDIANSIIESEMDIIAFSLAGTDDASNSCRKNVSFEHVCENIKFLRQKIIKRGKGPQIHLSYIMLADRISAVKDIPKLMDKLDVDAAIISTLDYLAIPQHKALAFAKNEKEKIENARKVLEACAEDARKTGRLICYGLPADEIAPGGCRENAEHSAYISADGKMSPCVYLNVPGNDPPEKRAVFADITKEDAWKAWNSPQYSEFRQKLCKNNPMPVCKNCAKRFEKISL